MKKREVFNYPPTVEVLRILTAGSLKQNLGKAVRLWVILRSIYGDESDEVKLELGEKFHFLQWRDLFFMDAKKYHQRDIIPSLHCINELNTTFQKDQCFCAIKLKQWLFELNLKVDEKQWSESFKKYYFIQDDELKQILLTGIIKHSYQNSQHNDNSLNTNNQFSKSLPDGRLFAVTSRNLKDNDFQSLIRLGCLKSKKIKNQDIYIKVDKFPELFLNHLGNEAIQTEQFTHEELSAFSNSLSQPINGIQRFFIHAEYIVHPRLYDRVEQLQQELKNIWKQDKVPLVQLNYQSAKLYQDTVYCIVYPVCIYYYKRAPYLFAYGQTPQINGEDSWSKIDWYDYRLDRILALEQLSIDADNINITNIPKHFLDKCYGKYSPSPDDIKEKMSTAWGFDIYKPQELLILRFDQYFYGNYIQGTERDEMFHKITRQQVEKLIKSYTPTASIEQKKLLATVQSRSTNDIYCKINYRVDDNNIVMRLRAWCPNVEVILPLDLRYKMRKEMEQTYKLHS
ncbi:TIGR03985 family CRISPR-associated protein [Rivularia sp. UHCC 0363]|uniref:TIGR03985 family CRISPR-associated protein n=1 Tax=Rivularia sp. UHCC 0363 TaxID=3110244 RepID=UPI002B214D2B|nr:TIGR03985 family CRISPR-associated protein [Rivularia sp. UHCC 0363]MEA5596731.1 TIGR03985 family CRISPR-associated protein [Rivularia sp. UHCC 0363]